MQNLTKFKCLFLHDTEVLHQNAIEYSPTMLRMIKKHVESEIFGNYFLRT